jgi:DNA-binding MarR family transcriptional regulator
MNADEIIDFHLRHAWHKIARMYNQRASEHGVTMSMGFILLIIDKEGTPSTQLGPRMGMEPTSLSRTLKTMEERGLIFRKTDKLDKRKVLIFLSEEGVKTRKMAKEVVVSFNEGLKEKISPAKLRVFFEVMDKIDRAVEEELRTLHMRF